jgi:hypothetical protein
MLVNFYSSGGKKGGVMGLKRSPESPKKAQKLRF